MIVELENISKHFPGVLALDNVNLSVRKGSTHALVGENGAGKSTLMKILSGAYTKYDGNIYFNGTKVIFNNEKDALDAGIAIVPQELNPIPDLTIAENIFLGREPMYGKVFINKKKRYQETKDLLKSLSLDYDPNIKMKHLSVAQRQLVEIIKAISRNAKLIIMDEPTSALTNKEIEYLFLQIESLRASGITVIFISHKLNEIYRVCDTVTVLRDGSLIKTVALSEVDTDTLISMMVGRNVQDIYPPLPVSGESEILKVRNLSGEQFHNISFSVKRGEILGFAGMMGSGRSEIVRAIFGMDPINSGDIFVEGEQINVRHPIDSIAKGIVLVTEDRATYGFVGIRSIEENISLPNIDIFASKGILKRNIIENRTDEICKKLKIKAPNWKANIGTLSGGNQQKVVLAKWLIRNIKVLILDEPTRGIDVGTKQEIYRYIVDLARQGIAVILISSEMHEVLAMSHRIKVVARGTFVGEYSHEEVTQDLIMKAIVKGRISNEE